MMEIIDKYQTGGPISAPATVSHLGPDGLPTIFAGSDALYAWRAIDGKLMPGFPVEGQNFFASKPVVIPSYLAQPGTDPSPGLIFIGNDDDRLYGFDWSGQPLPGFPLRTGGDVYSTPAVADLDGDGRPEIVVGSDDGRVYAWRLPQEPGSAVQLLSGWPQETGGFVSASPVIADLDGDGELEILVGSWDGKVYAWRKDGRLLPGWPQETGQSIWSACRVADLNNDGWPEIITASDGVYAWKAVGEPLEGWPQATGSMVVGRPVVADLDGDGELEVIAAADRVYVWKNNGQPLPGYPLDLGTFFWSAPVVDSGQNGQEPQLYLPGWDGALHRLSASGPEERLQLSQEPFFATPTLASLNGDGHREIIVGAWDGFLYIVRSNSTKGHPAWDQHDAAPVPKIADAAAITTVPEAVAPFISFPGPISSRATMIYRARRNNVNNARSTQQTHPVPLVVHHGKLTGLVQPFPAGVNVEFWLESEGERWPTVGSYNYKVVPDWSARLRRRLRKWRSRR